MKTIINNALAIVLMSCVASCAEPVLSESFQKNSERDAMGRFSFTLDMSDSLSTYDLAFYTVLEGGISKMEEPGDIPVEVRLFSPTGECFEEEFLLPGSSFVRKGPFRKYCEVDYRRDCSPKVKGVWTLKAYVSPDSVNGLGLICRRKYGER